MFFLFYYQTSYSQVGSLQKNTKVLIDSSPKAHLLKNSQTNLPDYAARLPISGWVTELGISPKEEIWMATKAGNTYYTKVVGELWHFGPFGSKDPFSSDIGETYERVNFFSEDTLMISGFIQGENSIADFIYWSGNHGKNWEKIKFGESSWIDAAFVNNKGKAWMSGSSQFIYYSQDNGRTWEQKSKVEPNSNLRFSAIHFADDERTGLFGSHWNVIYRTKDNGKTWEKLPTPLSQGKYKNLSKQDRPDIRKIRIFRDQYLVNQQGRIFHSSQENINWQPIPKIIDFEVTEDGSVYLVHQDLTLEMRNSEFITLWKSMEKLDEPPAAIAVRHNNLFVYTHDFIYKINKSEIKSSGILTTEVPIEEPYVKVKFNKEEIGFERKDVLRLDKKKNQWYRSQILPFAVGNAAIFNDHLIISDDALNNKYTLDPASQKLEKYELPPSLFHLSENGVKLFSMEQGSQGCFHQENNIKTFVRKGDFFVLNQNKKLKNILNNIPKQIPTHTINHMLQTVNDTRNKEVKVADLQLTEKDLTSFKSFIAEKEKEIIKNGIGRFATDDYYCFPGEKTDFSFYRAVAESITSIPDSVINKVFSIGYGNLSTTTNWIKLTFVFQDGRKLTITNQDDKPNYLYTPWIIDFDGLLLKSNSLDLGRQINALTGGEFFNPITKDKKYALFRIADYVYRESLAQP